MDKILRIFFWITLLIGGAIIGLRLDYYWFHEWLVNPIFHGISFVVGIYLLRLVINSSRNTGRLLARLGREGELPRMATNKLVTEGYYSCMRHPMHFGLFLFPFALAFLVGSISFIIIIAPLEIIVMIILIKLIEEPQAIKKFGNDYLHYSEQTPMFSVKWECLKELFAKKD
jgi:protein-S-isoprenylcysteine O-methyltransferase Ste14